MKNPLRRGGLLPRVEDQVHYLYSNAAEGVVKSPAIFFFKELATVRPRLCSPVGIYVEGYMELLS
jgi:hypothetical protein